MQPEERFERIERQMEFLASHQAQLAVNVEKHSEQVSQLGDFLLRTARLMEDQARRTDQRFQQIAVWMDQLTVRIDQLTDRMDQLTDRLDRLAQAQQHTDERLNTLINVVERYFSNGRPN